MRGLLAPLATLALAGCTAPPPRRSPTVATPPPAIPTLAPPRPGPTDWRDLPLTPGEWRYATEASGSRASYGPPGTPSFVLRCDPAQHVVTLTRPVGTGDAITIRTSYGSRTLPAGTPPGGGIAASLAARDPTLDQLAFSRGRFSVAGTGVPTLYLPAWAEPARVIEDCR